VSNQRKEFTRADLRGAWFRHSDLGDVHMRGVNLGGADLWGEIEGWGEIDGLRVNGVEVAPLIEAELDRRHPERAVLRAKDPDALRAGWAGLEAMWAATLERIATMPAGTASVSVDGEWSLAETLRHLVLATDGWLGGAIHGREHPFHPLGMPFWEWHGKAAELGLDVDAAPTFEEVLTARADRVAMVRDYLATATAADLAATNDGPLWERRTFTALECLGVIFNEEWWHHQFAVRDLDAIAAGAAP